jgi:hypothetical protein
MGKIRRKRSTLGNRNMACITTIASITLLNNMSFASELRHAICMLPLSYALGYVMLKANFDGLRSLWCYIDGLAEHMDGVETPGWRMCKAPL